MDRDTIIRMARLAGFGVVYEIPDNIKPLERFAALVAAAERERAILIAKNMKEELEAKFEQTYMEGVIAGAAAEREACAKVCDDEGLHITASIIRARGQE